MSLFDKLVEAVKKNSPIFDMNKKFLSEKALAAIYADAKNKK